MTHEHATLDRQQARGLRNHTVPVRLRVQYVDVRGTVSSVWGTTHADSQHGKTQTKKKKKKEKEKEKEIKKKRSARVTITATMQGAAIERAGSCCNNTHAHG